MELQVQTLTPEEIEVIKRMTGSQSLGASKSVSYANRNKEYCWIDKAYLIKSGLVNENNSISLTGIFGFALKDLDFVKTNNAYLIYSIDNKKKKFTLDKLDKAVSYFIKQI